MITNFKIQKLNCYTLVLKRLKYYKQKYIDTNLL